MADFLNESNGAKTSARDNGSGEPITDVSIADNSEQNPLYVKGLQGEPGPQGLKGIPVRRDQRETKEILVLKVQRRCWPTR